MIFITCSRCWSFDFVLTVFTCPWIVTTTVLLVFFVPHIKLVYLAFVLVITNFISISLVASWSYWQTQCEMGRCMERVGLYDEDSFI